MATVMGFTELLMSRDADEEQQVQWLAWLDHLYEDSHRVIATVDELLNVSRIQSATSPSNAAHGHQASAGPRLGVAHDGD